MCLSCRQEWKKKSYVEAIHSLYKYPPYKDVELGNGLSVDNRVKDIDAFIRCITTPIHMVEINVFGEIDKAPQQEIDQLYDTLLKLNT